MDPTNIIRQEHQKRNEVDQNQEVLQGLEADQEVHLVQEAGQEVLQEVDLEVDPVLDLEVDHEHEVEHQRRREVEVKNDQEAPKKRNPRNGEINFDCVNYTVSFIKL